MRRGRRPRLATWLDARYERLGFEYRRRALFGGVYAGVVVGIVGAALTLLYTPTLTFTDLLIITTISICIYLADGTLALRPLRAAIAPAERWTRDRDEESARCAWDALADLPFALMRQRRTYPVILLLLIVWDIVGVRRLDLSTTSSLLFLPGSILVYAYWLALRFFAFEQLLHAPLAEIGRSLPDGGGVDEPRVTLAQRLLVAVPAITVIAGTVVAGVVGNHTLETLSLGVGASILVAATIAAALVVLLADSIAGPVTELRAAAERVGQGDLDVQVPVISVDETGALARSFNAMVEGLRERERIRETFGTYVDRDVAEHILREGTALEGEEVEITALFLDIRNFTGFAERSPAPEVVGALNRLFERVVPIIRECGGHVDKFVGDGLLAVFGAPRRREDHADAALTAALKIAAAVEDEFGSDLSVGVGLNSGTVVAGNVGGAGRLEFSVIGDAVNVAARVESATRQTGDVVLVSEYTRRLLRSGDVELEPREGVPLKGKSEEIALFAPVYDGARPPIEPRD